jgi:peroxiredoxin
LKAIDGTSLRLSDYRGKVILLDFWATWCAPCQEEIPRFVEWQNEYRDRGLQVIGVSMDDSPEPVQKFSREFRMNYPVAIGTQDIASQYGGILGLPVNFVIGRDGRIKAKHLGMYDLMLLKRELNEQLESKK